MWLATIGLTMTACLIGTMTLSSPSHTSSQDWNAAKSKLATFQKANLIPRNGQADTRRELRGIELQHASAVGFFYWSSEGLRSFGNGFAVKSRNVLLTAAHLFAKDGKWTEKLRGPDGSPNLRSIEFYSDACGKSYRIKSLDVATMVPIPEQENDVAIVVLAEALCEKAVPLMLRPIGDADVEGLMKQNATKKEYVSVPAFQPNKRIFDHTPRNELFTSKMISYGEITGFTSGYDNKLVMHSASMLPGASGGPLIAYTGAGGTVPLAIGIIVSESPTGTYNSARIIDRQLNEKVEKIVQENR